MINDTLYFIQERLYKKLLNLNIKDFDKHKYTLLIRDILFEVNTIMPIFNLREDSITVELNERYMLISITSLNNRFCIYLEVKDNSFSDVEISFLC